MKKCIVIIGILFFTSGLAVIENRAATFTVSNNANSGTGSLRQAVLNANTSGNANDTIVFAANVRGKIVLTGFEIELNKPIGTNLTIIGPGADVLSVESNFAFRVLRAQSGNIKISGLRISRGSGAASGGLGGGIFVVEGANLMFENCSIAGNQGGGIATMSDSTLTINNSTISGNHGGGILGAGVLSVSNSTVSDNFTADIAGIGWANGTVTLTNITVSGNRGFDTGGISINGATTTILNSTIAENFAGNNGAAQTGGLRIQSGTVNLKNTIIANNTGFTPDINGTINSQGNNLIRNRTGGTGFIASDLPNNTNPRFGGFANNGGATYTYSLRPTSPAINAGNNTGAPATDQRGVARPQGTAVDIGAYESGVRPVAFGKIVFVSDRDGNREIYSINADGTNTTRHTTNFVENDEYPDWSPDGSKIAFSTNRDGNFEIYTIDTNGITTPARLTNNSVSDSEPAFSPDGSKIAFVRNGAGIFLMDANGANQTAVPNTTDGASPSWSPDGTQIVFTCNNMGSAICKINADGTNRTPFVFNDAIHTSPAWSPDGNSIAFSIDFNVSPFFYFYDPYNVNVFRPMINPATGSEVVGFAAAFSPDGAKIADGTGNLFLRDADGGNPVLLINSTVSGNGNSFQPDWFGQNTPTGANVSAVSGTTTITFSGVSTGGTTTAVPINPASAGAVPSGYSLGAGYPAYEITTTANYTAPIVVCLQVQSTISMATFNTLRILHYVNGTPTDATILAPDTPAPNFANKTICARVNSLSPFVVTNAQPTAASVSVGGRVSTSGGRGISKALVSITNQNGETQTVSTDSFGYYRFDEISVGETYIITVRHKRYQFTNNSQVLTVFEDTNDVNFTAQWIKREDNEKETNDYFWNSCLQVFFRQPLFQPKQLNQID